MQNTGMIHISTGMGLGGMRFHHAALKGVQYKTGITQKEEKRFYAKQLKLNLLKSLPLCRNHRPVEYVKQYSKMQSAKSRMWEIPKDIHEFSKLAHGSDFKNLADKSYTYFLSGS